MWTAGWVRVASSRVPAAENTLRILGYMASRRGPIGAAALATALGLPRSSVYHLLSVMEDQGYVLHLPHERAYGLGIAAFELSSAYSRQEPLARLGRPLLAALVDRVGESAHLAVLHGRDVLYLVEERAKNRPSLVTEVGVRLPAHLTASGRAILAALPASQRRALYSDTSAFTVRQPDPAITGYSQLKSHLEEVRRRGHATEEGEVSAGFTSLAVVALDHVGWPAAAVATTFLGHRVTAEWRRALVDELRSVAAEVSRRIYGA